MWRRCRSCQRSFAIGSWVNLRSDLTNTASVWWSFGDCCWAMQPVCLCLCPEAWEGSPVCKVAACAESPDSSWWNYVVSWLYCHTLQVDANSACLWGWKRWLFCMSKGWICLRPARVYYNEWSWHLHLWVKWWNQHLLFPSAEGAKHGELVCWYQVKRLFQCMKQIS